MIKLNLRVASGPASVRLVFGDAGHPKRLEASDGLSAGLSDNETSVSVLEDA